MNAPVKVSAATKAAEVRSLATMAQSFGIRIDVFEASLDPAWRHQFSAALGHLSAGQPSMRAQRLRLALFRCLCGPVPELDRLRGVPASWSLQPRESVLPRLCAFALASRPGVIRSCVRRTARQSLEQMLGPVYTSLRESACGGAAVTSAVAERPPLEWAWVGYSDMTRRALWPSRSLRRLVRLALPPGRRTDLRRACKSEPHDPLQLMSEVDAWFSAAGQIS